MGTYNETGTTLADLAQTMSSILVLALMGKEYQIVNTDTMRVERIAATGDQQAIDYANRHYHDDSWVLLDKNGEHVTEHLYSEKLGEKSI